MFCSSCASTMRSTKAAVNTNSTQQELRCPRCGNQYIKSQLVVEGEPFDIDPYTNFSKLQRDSVQENLSTSTPASSSPGN